MEHSSRGGPMEGSGARWEERRPPPARHAHASPRPGTGTDAAYGRRRSAGRRRCRSPHAPRAVSQRRGPSRNAVTRGMGGGRRRGGRPHCPRPARASRRELVCRRRPPCRGCRASGGGGGGGARRGCHAGGRPCRAAAAVTSSVSGGRGKERSSEEKRKGGEEKWKLGIYLLLRIRMRCRRR